MKRWEKEKPASSYLRNSWPTEMRRLNKAKVKEIRGGATHDLVVAWGRRKGGKEEGARTWPLVEL